MTAPLSSDLQEILEIIENEYFEHESCGYEIECVLTSDTLKTALTAFIQSRERALLERMLEVGDEKDNYATRVLNNINEALATLTNNEEDNHGSI